LWTGDERQALADGGRADRSARWRVVAAMTSRFLAAALLVLAAAAPAAASPGDAALADVDPDNDDVVAPPEPIADCEARLRAAGVRFAPASMPVMVGRGRQPTCGVAQAVVYQRGPAKVRYQRSPVVSCGMALGLARFEQVVAEEAQRHLGKRVVRIEHGGTYNCRRMARFDLVSEHSYANAIDIRSVTLEGGRTLAVKSTFGRLDAAPTRREALFWRSVASRLFDEGVFSVVLTPFFDRHHHDHLHMDLARYRVDGTRAATEAAAR
jgi:hypothetical protein